MNSFDELELLKISLIQYKHSLLNYGGDINPKKVISALDKILEV